MFRTLLKTFIPGLVAASLSVNALADDTVAKIQQKLNQVIPTAPSADITKSQVEGLYQVVLGPNVIYITADAKYLFNGNLIDLDSRENLTEIAKDQARVKVLAEIDPQSMVTFKAKGEEKRTITVFTDIDCPFCKRFHNEVKALNENGITVRYLAFPRSGPNTPSYHKMVSVWCDKDPVKAMDDAKNGMEANNQRCENPVQMHMMYAQQFGITGTPTMIVDDGSMIPGYVEAKELIPALLAP
ncbi:DsbC family protein [Thiomicrospira microaerophila]|uniref:DsbC family protein n=1 Tax=Thiomicrospira microaerophila TaxID=406020 RepID=UPI00200FD84B|nr:DsbC family protein [Thiomicrospira microaerophila]UQB41345.1 DsbC family protein [Thiomicrospira microaerophila]